MQSVRPFGCFQFHSVGQGLFYSGVIENGSDSFVFVYDCGGSNKSIVGEAVDRFIGSLGGKKIDLLVLSHLHEDHINGLERILGELKPGGKIVMPYIDRNLQLIYKYQYRYHHPEENEVDSFLDRFYDDPVGVIRSRINPEVSIYMVSSPMEDFKDDTYYHEEYGENNSSRLYRRDGKDSQFPIHLSRGLFFQELGLEFRITQPFFSKETYDAISVFLDRNKDIRDLHKDKKAIAELRSKNKDQNKSCLLMEHWFSHSLIPSYSILTGDLPEEKVQRIKNYLYRTDRPFVFQIPHHGAKDTASVTNSVISVVSHGIKNKHGHPSWYSLSQYLASGSVIVDVNDNNHMSLVFYPDLWLLNRNAFCVGKQVIGYCPFLWSFPDYVQLM